MPKSLILVFFLKMSIAVHGQRIFNAHIIFPQELSTEKVKIFYDNGKGIMKIKGPFLDNKVNITDSLYSKFATISCMYYGSYSQSSFGMSFFVWDAPDTILINKNKDTLANPFANYQLTNAYDINETGAYKKMKSVLDDDWADYHSFLIMHNSEFDASDSLNSIRKIKHGRILKKELDFIRQNGQEYYSFWFFKNELMYEKDFLSADTLLKVYNEAFSEEIKNSFEGKQVVSILKGRSNIAGNNYAPYFKSVDINNNIIDLENFKGKYVLLNFWASWCGPCIAEMGTIRRLNDTYKEQLVVVSISTDRNKKEFMQAIKKYKMNWINIFHDTALENIFLQTGSIPQVYLINPGGELIYSREDQKDFDLQKLKRLLKDNM
ncbi:MAG: TlpA disulfide reductase family protein [Ginsengibacter sp.]